MPKRSNRRHKSSSSSSGSSLFRGVDRTVTINGRALLTVTGIAASNYASLDLKPQNFGDRATDLASSFQFFRFTSLVLNLQPTLASETAVGYSKRLVDPAIFPSLSGIAPIYELDASRYSNGATTVPVMLKLRKTDLKSASKVWYPLSNFAGSDYFDTVQGTIVSYNSAAGNGITLECAYTIQFRGPNSPFMTPAV